MLLLYCLGSDNIEAEDGGGGGGDANDDDARN